MKLIVTSSLLVVAAGTIGTLGCSSSDSAGARHADAAVDGTAGASAGGTAGANTGGAAGANTGGAAGANTGGAAGASAEAGPVTDGGKMLPVICTPDESAPVPTNRCRTGDAGDPALPPCNQWVKVEIPGTLCGDGSQYKFFVNYSDKSNDLEVAFEPGGACWDYESCSGAGGIRGAANPHGIPDDHMSQYQYLNLNRRDASNPVANWNMVWVSYCTGDVHTGDNVATYRSAGAVDGGSSDGGTAELVFHHRGHQNTLAVVDWIHTHFTGVPKMLVTGCSAGGAGALLNYHYLRKGMGTNVQCGYLLDDSGPIFHSDGPSKALHAKIRSAWNVDPVIDALGTDLPISAAAIKSDFGLVNTALAEKYPKDRLAITLYRMDFNYSLYSYQRFFTPSPTEAQIHAFWWEDIKGLMTMYDAQPNLSYFIPFFRTDNCSHCVSIPPIGPPLDIAKILATPWAGTEIQADRLDLHRFIEDLLDDKKPMQSYLEPPQPNESFPPAESAQCMAGG